MGGTSSERDVSLRSGENVYGALKRKGHNIIKYDFKGDIRELFSLNYDIAFNIIHGGEGEDGKLSGFFEMAHKMFIGSDENTQAITLEKHFCQPLIKSFGLNIPQYITIFKGDDYKEKLKEFIKNTGKVILKPSSEGSSVGLLITDNYEKALEHVKKNLMDYNVLICEEYIKGVELTVGMIGRGNNIKIFTPLEIRAKKKFYNYEAKYTPGATDFIIPPEINPKFIERAKSEANIIFKNFNIKDFARADCILYNNKLFWHDVNTVPGMTNLSDLPQMAAYEGIDFDDLVERIVLGAMEI